MFRVNKSQIGDESAFAKAVEDHVRELNAWHSHMAKVGVDPEYVAHPRPTAAQVIESAITDDDGVFRSSFEIIDDSPSKEQVLLAKKAALFERITAMEHAASNAVFPFGRRRLAQRRASQIKAKNSEAKNAFLHAANKNWNKRLEEAAKKKPGVAGDRVLAQVGPAPTEEDADRHVAANCDPADRDHLAAQADHERRIEAIMHHGAVLQDQVEDLTLENIDDWTPAPFPT